MACIWREEDELVKRAHGCKGEIKKVQGVLLQSSCPDALLLYAGLWAHGASFEWKAKPSCCVGLHCLELFSSELSTYIADDKCSCYLWHFSPFVRRKKNKTKTTTKEILTLTVTLSSSSKRRQCKFVFIFFSTVSRLRVACWVTEHIDLGT